MAERHLSIRPATGLIKARVVRQINPVADFKIARANVAVEADDVRERHIIARRDVRERVASANYMVVAIASSVVAFIMRIAVAIAR